MSEFVEKYINPFTDYGFKKLFETAEIAKFTPDQVRSYEDSLKYYRDLKNSLDTAREEGIEEGIEQGIERGIKQGLEQGILKEKTTIIIQMLADNEPIEKIIRYTGMTKEQIEGIKKA